MEAEEQEEADKENGGVVGDDEFTVGMNENQGYFGKRKKVSSRKPLGSVNDGDVSEESLSPRSAPSKKGRLVD